MKKPHIPWLSVITLLVAGFTLGLFVGRNYLKSEITVSIPDTMVSPGQVSAKAVEKFSSEDPSIAFPININTALLDELRALPGIGDGLAWEIISYRENNGAFSHVEELMNVPGIGEKRLEAIWDLITVGGTQ